MENPPSAGAVTPEMIDAAAHVLGHKHKAALPLVPALYHAMRLARPLSEGPGLTDAETRRSGVAAILLWLLLIIVSVAVWHARG